MPDIFRPFYGAASHCTMQGDPEENMRSLPTCFVSLTYGHRFTDWVYDRVREVGEEIGFRVRRGANQSDLAVAVRQKVRDAIDEAFIVVAEVSGFSWFVAFEIFHAIEQKPCVLLMLDEGLPGAHFDRSAANVFPDLDRLQYRLPLQSDDGTELRTSLERALRSLLHRAASWSTNLTAAGLHATGHQIPANPIDPTIRFGDDIQRPDVRNEVFPSWLETTAGARRIAVIAPPGAGKTLLLLRFTQWLSQRRLVVPEHTRTLPPLGVLVTAADLHEQVGANSIWRVIFDRTRKMTRADHAPLGPGLLEPFRDAGLLYLMLDGLDEFSVRRRNEVGPLMEELAHLAASGVNVIVSCRRNVWQQLIRTTYPYEVVELLALDPEQVARLLEGITLPRTAYDAAGKIKSWLLNPLLLGFIKAIHGTPEWADAPLSRSRLYDTWAQWVVEQEARRCQIPKSTLRTFFANLALKLLRQRRVSVPLHTLRDILPVMPTGGLATALQLSAMAPLVLAADDHVQYFHESVYEYFAIIDLKEEFWKALGEGMLFADLERLKLQSVELDYLQASVYGLLDESLGPEYLKALQQRLAAADLPQIPWLLLRNLVEYLGMAYRGDDDRAVATTLLMMVRDERLNMRVRYNAARALERIHPDAPRPYFDYVSDWGEQDWSHRRAIAAQTNETPWVMRGAGLGEPRVGRHWAFTPNRKAADAALGHDVSRQLTEILMHLLREPTEAARPLRINCSHAYIRWHDPAHAAQLDELRKLAADQGIDVHTRENLNNWTGRPLTRTAAATPPTERHYPPVPP